MAPCLVQQLFRQKIGVELDQGLIDEVLFPMLRLRKHLPKDLLQDIKLATDTLIITRQAGHFSVPTFTPIPEYWTYSPPWHLGQRTSKVRQEKIRNQDWGTIDILNKLRGLNYPQVGYKPRPYVIEEPVDSFDDAYISLSEDNSLPATIRWGTEGIVDHSRENSVQRILIARRSQFVNNFLDDVLITGKRLTWGAQVRDPVGGILSIVESSQHGEVRNQLY
jgi:hypothetical protein